MTLPRPCDPELALSLAYAPVAARAGLAALWMLDERMGGIVVEPNRPIAAIKLAWWREALDRLDRQAAPPEPLLAALAGEVVARGVSGARLAEIAAGWDALIDDEEHGESRTVRHARQRGAALFTAAAELLGGAGGIDVAAAGATWAAATIPAAFGRANVPAVAPCRWPRRLRALGVLAIFARARLRAPGDPPASPGRVARALWLGLSGR